MVKCREIYRPGATCAQRHGRPDNTTKRERLDILLLEDLVPDARQWLEARHQVDYRPELLEDEALLRARLYKVDALKLIVTRIEPPGRSVIDDARR